MLTRAQHFRSLLDELARMRGRTLGAFREIREGLGIADMETVVLSAVVVAKHPPTVPQIGRSLGHPRQVIQRAADALAARGFVAWQDNSEHKRAKLLVPTDAGRALQEQGDAQGLALAEELTRGLDADLIAQAVSVLHTIRETIEKNLRQTEEDGEP